MIKPQDQVFANLITQLHRDLPLEPLTRVVNLAALALGILRSKSRQVGQILTALPLAGTRDTLKKRVQRFLKNPDVTSEIYSEQQALLAVVAQWRPRRADVLLLGDREFGTGVLAQWARQQGWGVCLRLRAHEYGGRAGALYFEPLPLVLPGARRVWPQVTFTQNHAVGGLKLARYWTPTAAAPWYLVTTEPTCKLACSSYQKRFRIEAMCKDFNNNGRGFGLELTGVRHADRLARLLLALALVYTWRLLWGAHVSATGQHKLVDNVRRPTLSLFQTGLRFVL